MASEPALSFRRPTPEPLPPAGEKRPTAGWNRPWVRRLHAVIGLVASLNLLLLLGTGFLLQHRETFGLEEKLVSRSLLPGDYRPLDGADGVRADIVVTDLHSGRLFGATGALVLDGITLGWFVLLLSGLYLFVVGRSNGAARNGNGKHRR